MRASLFALILSLVFLKASAQDFDFTLKSNWQENPQIHKTSARFDSSSAVGILDDRSIEYVIDKGNIYIRSIFHKIVKINTDKGIEMFNKIYIPLYRGSEITDIKARTILKSGKVIDLPASKIKEIEEDGRTYKLFAMEGVEKGSEIEYIYTMKRPMNPFGLEIYQGANVPYERVQFSLVAPDHLQFLVKGYNGFLVSNDSIINEKRVVVGYANDVNQLEEEKYAVSNPYLKRVQYKLDYNLAGSNVERMYTWKDFAKRAFNAYTMYSTKEEKALDKLAEQIDLAAAKSEAEKILLIEDYVKSNFNIDEKIRGEDVEALDKVVKTRNTNRDGSIRMFTALFDRLNVNYQIVFASDRSEFPIEEDIENWNAVDDIVFYFPKTGKYMSPMSVEFRYPYIPAYLTGIKGLFLKSTTIGSYKTAIPVFNIVGMEPYEEHAINMEAVVKFDETLDTLLISSKQILKGYGAAAYRPIYTFLPKDKQDEANRDIIKSVANSSDISNVKVENAHLKDYFSNKPLVIGGDIKSTELLESAGNKILFKIGEIIGPQAEMYQEKPRQLPIELDYPHVLDRKISFEIPSGYSVKNLKDLNFDISFKKGENISMGFLSSYTVDGNTVTVTVSEIYRDLKYPITEFENFKKVINAAADFNKVVLVLEKK
jgi:hypothetical protein